MKVTQNRQESVADKLNTGIQLLEYPIPRMSSSVLLHSALYDPNPFSGFSDL